jgi:hemerythrin-like domain-containing protein
MAAETPTQLVDTSVMPTLHTFFRREFRLAAGVVRGVPDGDLDRAAVVADHIAYLSRSLHHHHTIEDELLWPVLLERVPEELAPIVHLMESQHERVDGLIEDVDELLPRFRATADPLLRERLADVLDTLYVHLTEHLDAEEERLLPIAARTVTQAEWDALGEAGRSRGRRADLALTLGMFAYEGDPEVIAGMISEAPLLVRVIVPRLAGRAFRRHALRVHGTVSP